MPAQSKSLVLAFALCAATPAWADLTPASTGNSSFALVAFNTTTYSYYVRDLGYSLNQFLPSSVTTNVFDGGGSSVTGDKTPEEGLRLNWGDSTGAFGNWLAGQGGGDIVWTVAAGDSRSGAPSINLSRLLVAWSQPPVRTITNSDVRVAVSSGSGISALAGQNNDGTDWYDKTGDTVSPNFPTNNFFGSTTLSALGQAASLHYYTTTTGIGASVTAARSWDFANSSFAATMTFTSDGVLRYDLAAAVLPVPMPGTATLMVAGLFGVGIAVRRARRTSRVG